MFREMRRKKQLLSNEECIEILKSCATGIVPLTGMMVIRIRFRSTMSTKTGKYFFTAPKKDTKWTPS